jgi:hypothetical protein
MSLLNRPDGVQFVVQPYRERITIGKRSLMVQRIRLLSEQHGQYVLLSPLGEGALEAVFSREAGYLLGETVWMYFDRPAYLIFCERLSKDNNQVLLVIVRGNEIYLDALVDNDKLRAELLPLMTMQESFRVITYGEVTLNQNQAPGNFELPKNLVSSFEIAKEPVFKNLPILNDARLLTLLLALKSPLLGAKVQPIAIIGGVVTLLAVIWWFYPTASLNEKTGINNLLAQQPNLAYLDFYTAMKSPTPQQQLKELTQTIQAFYDLPGWQASNITYSSNQYRIQLNRDGGNLQWLEKWAAGQHFLLNLSSNGAEIVTPSLLTQRPAPKVVYPLSQVTASLIDQLDLLFPNQAVTISELKVSGQTQARTLNIRFVDASPDILELLGRTLGNELPLSIAMINIDVLGGLLNGSVQLSVWGT